MRQWLNEGDVVKWLGEGEGWCESERWFNSVR